MSTDGVAVSSGSAPTSAPGSPNQTRLKFLCSHGGKILPRPTDGNLKYVGGETRVISVPRDIPFQELMKKLTHLIDGEMTLKYQVASEDLDALVTVKTDEDLSHMFDEISRYETAGAPKLRAFLFPANPVVMENQIGSVDPGVLEQRYIDAINGIIRSAPQSIRIHPTINAMQQHGSLVSSACSSPRSPDSCTTEALNEGPMIQNNYYNTRPTSKMHRVRSSPSICSLNTAPQQIGHHLVHQFSSQYVHYPNSYQSPRPPIDSQKSVAPEKLISVRSVGQADGVRYQMDPLPSNYYSNSRQNRGNGLVHYDEYGYVIDRRMSERNGSRATSPVSASPLGYGVKAWDTTMRGDV